MLLVKFKKTHPDAKTPTKHLEAACWDLYSVVETEIFPGQTKIIDAGISIELPKGWLARIHTRSGYALRGLRNNQGILDQDYRGEIGPIMRNCSDTVVGIHKGDRVAQIYFEKIDEIALEEVTELEVTERGEKGFGSSGK